MKTGFSGWTYPRYSKASQNECVFSTSHRRSNTLWRKKLGKCMEEKYKQQEQELETNTGLGEAQNGGDSVHPDQQEDQIQAETPRVDLPVQEDGELQEQPIK